MRTRAIYRSHETIFNNNPDPVVLDEEVFSSLLTVSAQPPVGGTAVNTIHYLLKMHMNGTNASPEDFVFLAFDRTDELESPLEMMHLSSVAIKFAAAG